MKNDKNLSVVLFILILTFFISFCSGQSTTVSKINTKGVYYHFNSRPVYDTSNSYMEFLFFYTDGTVTSFVERTKSNEMNYVLKNIDMYQAIESWGIYKINNDTIRAQILIHDPSRIGKIAEEWTIIIHDNATMYLSQTICDRCENHYVEYNSKNKIIFQPMLQYKFMTSLIKPDSSKMGKYYKRWIKKKLD